MAKMILALALFLTGCASSSQVRNIVTQCPTPPEIQRPELDTDNLKSGDTPDIVIQAHRITIKKLQKWGIEQESILDGYRTNK